MDKGRTPLGYDVNNKPLYEGDQVRFRVSKDENSAYITGEKAHLPHDVVFGVYPQTKPDQKLPGFIGPAIAEHGWVYGDVPAWSFGFATRVLRVELINEYEEEIDPYPAGVTLRVTNFDSTKSASCWLQAVTDMRDGNPLTYDEAERRIMRFYEELTCGNDPNAVVTEIPLSMVSIVRLAAERCGVKVELIDLEDEQEGNLDIG